jgi:hypothetical protein
MSQGLGANFDRAQRAYDNRDPYPRPPQSFFDELAEHCTCTPLSDRPCAGLQAGGLCDDLHMDREITDENDEDDTEPDEL